jgi:hypothetical protein
MFRGVILGGEGPRHSVLWATAVLRNKRFYYDELIKVAVLESFVIEKPVRATYSCDIQ